MRVLIGCEYSGTVRDAFIARGHDAWSCDILPTERPGPHFQRDLLEVIGMGWDMAIFHPPRTHLAVSGSRHFKNKLEKQAQALDFVRRLFDAPIPRICIENPVSIISTRLGKPQQIIQPYQFGDPDRKTTCLWLQFLPCLVQTNVVKPEMVVGKDGKTYSRFHRETFYLPRSIRGHARSKTYHGIADAMADQWGCLA